jgi:hypothetical protein
MLNVCSDYNSQQCEDQEGKHRKCKKLFARLFYYTTTRAQIAHTQATPGFSPGVAWLKKTSEGMPRTRPPQRAYGLTTAAKMSELPNVARQAEFGAGLAIGVPVASDCR